MQGPQTGMGPIWLQGGRWKKCDQLHTEPCDIDATDQCCAVIPCTLCLRWEVYGEPDVGGIAIYDRDSNQWRGGFGDTRFVAYWQRNYGSDECEFIVELEGEVVAVKNCYDLSCRNLSSSEPLTINYDQGILYWEPYERRSLPHAIGDDGCPTFFCGECECTCEKLCVSIVATINPYSVFTMEGQGFVSGTGNCYAPEWSGSVEVSLGALSESIDVEIYMFRDNYTGDCWIGGTVRGQDLTPKRLIGCDVSGVFELPDGSTVNVKCYACVCANTVCEFCCLPLDFTNRDYPAGVYKPIPYFFDGCTNDPLEGNFATFPGNLPCTENVVFEGPSWSTPSHTMFVEGIDALGNCRTTPCTNDFSMRLVCAPTDNDTGCLSLALVITSSRPLVGADTPGGNTITIRPTSCSCDEVAGVSAIFNFNIQIDCSDKEYGSPYGPCAYNLLECCEDSCSGTVLI